MSGKQMKRLRKAAERIANFSAEQNKLSEVPDGYDIIDLNTGHKWQRKIEKDGAPPAILMHKEGSVKHIYKTLKKIK